MSDPEDPFRHHPGLRDLIADPEQSFFRSFQPSQLDASMAELGLGPDWRYSDDERNTLLGATLEPLLGQGDLWVFAYGSLMWDPAFRFREVRRARIGGFRRRFILWSRGGRGTPDRRAVMAALDHGGECRGLAFRIEGDELACELEILWRRERIAPAYNVAFVPAETDMGTVRALTFVADHAAENIRPDLTHEQQVEALATARGTLGSNLDYVLNLKDRLDALGIPDDEVDQLAAEALALNRALAKGQA